MMLFGPADGKGAVASSDKDVEKRSADSRKGTSLLRSSVVSAQVNVRRWQRLEPWYFRASTFDVVHARTYRYCVMVALLRIEKGKRVRLRQIHSHVRF